MLDTSSENAFATWNQTVLFSRRRPESAWRGFDLLFPDAVYPFPFS
jgi:hypothetical protein